MTRRVPDLWADFYIHAREMGQDDDSAAWFAEMQMQQLAESPQLPNPDQLELTYDRRS